LKGRGRVGWARGERGSEARALTGKGKGIAEPSRGGEAVQRFLPGFERSRGRELSCSGRAE